MYECKKCNKRFNYESDYNRHNNRKTNCKKEKNDFNCGMCNSDFKYESEFLRHEKTKKHIINYNKNVINGDINGNQNHVGDINIQNIIQLTLNTNTFNNSNIGLVSNLSIELVYGIYDNIINNKYMATHTKALSLFKEAVIFILDTLHFNISNTENHNLKILLMFPKIDKLVYEYLILEIEQESSDLVWNSINYEQLLDEIFNLLININAKNIEKHNNEIREQNLVFVKFIDYLKNNLLTNEENKNEAKSEIESLLSELYIKFNKNQKKEERQVKLNILDKINEYKNYRTNECRLSNGYIPNVINSEV